MALIPDGFIASYMAMITTVNSPYHAVVRPFESGSLDASFLSPLLFVVEFLVFEALALVLDTAGLLRVFQRASLVFALVHLQDIYGVFTDYIWSENYSLHFQGIIHNQ